MSKMSDYFVMLFGMALIFLCHDFCDVHDDLDTAMYMTTLNIVMFVMAWVLSCPCAQTAISTLALMTEMSVVFFFNCYVRDVCDIHDGLKDCDLHDDHDSVMSKTHLLNIPYNTSFATNISMKRRVQNVSINIM
jgi:hypothetical protein